jgi:integrase
MRLKRIKEPVTIRQKTLANGNFSLYLDIYQNGVRKYEFLKLYIIPEKTPMAKLTNETTIRAAKAIQAERTQQLINAKAGIKNFNCKILLIDWMQKRVDDLIKAAIESGRTDTNSAKQVAKGLLHLRAYIQRNYGCKQITLNDVDKTFCAGFAEYLNNAAGRKNKHCEAKPLAPGTRAAYFKALSTALNTAVKDGHIESNPMNLLSHSRLIQNIATERIYLTADEMRKLINTPCPRKDVGDAFLFSCFCGLRWSDINALTWGDIHTGGNEWKIEIRMIKTRDLLYLPLSSEARGFIPERRDKTDIDKVFTLPVLDCAEINIKKWIGAAGINKHITFHCARHTFATLMLTLGADLYTTSKLLGHTNIQTTQIYAKIVDSKKTEAVNLTNGLFDK